MRILFLNIFKVDVRIEGTVPDIVYNKILFLRSVEFNKDGENFILYGSTVAL